MLLAAIYRIIFPELGYFELTQLGLSSLLLWPVIIFELIIGILLITDKHTIIASIAGISFMSIAILIGIVTNINGILRNIGELFIFNATPTDILLHLIYIGFFILIIKK